MPTGGPYNLPGFDPTYQQPGLPSYGTGVPSYLSMPSGGSGSALDKTSSTGGGYNWGSVAGPTAALVASAFAPTVPDIRGDVAGVKTAAGNLGAQGQQLTSLGLGSLGPVLKYFQSLLSWNPADVMSATAPDRARVIDQYDAARKSAAAFSPRGGGSASAPMNLKAKEAEQLAVLPAAARSNAAGELAALGSNLTSQGLTAQQASINDLASTLGPLFSQEQSDKQSQASTWETIGTIAAMAAMFL